MRQLVLVILILCLGTHLQGEETRDRPRARRGEAAGYSSRDATTLSMMGWGVVLGVLAAAVSVIFKDPSSNTDSNSH